MPRNGSGGYLPPQNSWNPAINGAQALPDDWMAILNDVSATLQASTAADGQTLITGVWNFGNNRISNVGAPIGQGNALRWEQLIKGPDIESAGTISVPVEGQLFDVTGTTTITTINDTFPGRLVVLRFMGELQLTHSANFQLPDGADIITVAGDVGLFVNIGPGAWRCISWPNGVYRRSNIVGPVSMSDDKPNGGVIESGGTGNARYTRFADGTLEMTIKNISISTAAQNTWVSSAPVSTPAEFINDGSFVGVAQMYNNPSAQGPVFRVNPSGTSAIVLSALSPVSAVSGMLVQIIIKARWA